MNKNTRHLLPRWGFAAVLGGIVIFGTVAAVIRGEYIIPLVLVVSLTLSGLQIWYSRRKTLSFFKDPTPDRAVAHYRSTLPKLPNGGALSSYMCAQALAFYGEFDKAREELSEVNWNSMPPMYQGFQCSVLAMLAILQERDYRKASELAEESCDLCTTSAHMPGSKQSRKSTEALVDACHVLAGDYSETALSQLEGVVQSLPPLGAIMPAWALVVHYKQASDPVRAQPYEELIRKLLPHFVLLKENATA